MMTDNELSSLPNPVGTATSDMNAFPDATSVAGSADKLTDVDGNSFDASDADGYVLYHHDRVGNSDSTNTVNYVATQTTAYTYTVDSMGTITQY